MTPVHVLSGFLGAGKTTLLLDQLQRRSERCAVVVNDFGEARIDAQLLGAQVAVTEIAGGCVCCTAPEALVPSIAAILDEVKPDRIFLEATGLARPADLVDTLRRSALAVEVMPVVVVVDPARVEGDAPPLLLEQLDAADVVVANARSEAPTPALDALCKEHWPALLQRVDTRDATVGTEVFEQRREGMTLRPVRTQGPSTEGYQAMSRTWPAELVFDMRQLKTLLSAAPVERLKGFFRTDLGWYRIDLASGRLHFAPGPMRSGSAVDIIARQDPSELLQALDEARWEDTTTGASTLRLQASDGWAVNLTRQALKAMPGQLADVGERIPGRKGEGVELAEVLALAHPPADASFVVVASDGMTSGPTALADVGQAVLVHGLDDDDLPRDQGGPFRVFAPKGLSACANVKSVVRIELV